MKRRGQSILEYVLILTAVVGLIIWAASSGGPMHQVANSSIQGASNLFDKAATKTANDFKNY